MKQFFLSPECSFLCCNKFLFSSINCTYHDHQGVTNSRSFAPAVETKPMSLQRQRLVPFLPGARGAGIIFMLLKQNTTQQKPPEK